MRKILSGMLGLIMTTAVVGGVAYAAFSSTAAVEGISFSSGSAALHVWNGSAYVPSWTSNWTFSGLFPGAVSAPMDFWLQNDSDVTITLGLNAKLRDGVTGDWAALKDKVWVAVTNFGTAPAGDSDYHTLAQWNAGTATFAAGTQSTLTQGEQHHFGFYVKVDPTAGSEIQAKSLTGVNYDFTGTQQ